MSNSNSVVKPKYNVVIALESLPNLLTQGKEYIVGNVAYGCQPLLVEADNGNTTELCAWRFKLKEENVVTNKRETKQYYEQRTGLVYDLVFQGERLTILKAVLSGSEVVVDIENLENTYHFIPYTKAMQKQAKHNEDLGVLANVTDEIRKLLDDNHVICHANVNRDTKGLVEYTIMLGESV